MVSRDRVLSSNAVPHRSCTLSCLFTFFPDGLINDPLIVRLTVINFDLFFGRPSGAFVFDSIALRANAEYTKKIFFSGRKAVLPNCKPGLFASFESRVARFKSFPVIAICIELKAGRNVNPYRGHLLFNVFKSTCHILTL